ncbi:carboxymuconolactone decarboxylase family protein [Desulfocucumis palustris]|uniref:Carboxymuconolactone decarboxylase family protein n=1 Tax=Desulfocucumis palustris TaxID=1898651 RepID=A0A2L2XDT3_9FIRM|nr:carboxymuconolactone decarboxylase family protein [Desulfocucumis palustris]GBF34398.1 carboxymuconolactone decarboxylase family protein [Desulfocucumis palustris]
MEKTNTMLAQIEQGKEFLQGARPELMNKFNQFHNEVFQDGTLSAREKRLIGLGMALALKCDFCIAVHLKALKAMGVSLEEVLEVCGVGMLMHGGPGMAYSTLTVKMWNEI